MSESVVRHSIPAAGEQLYLSVFDRHSTIVHQTIVTSGADKGRSLGQHSFTPPNHGASIVHQSP